MKYELPFRNSDISVNMLSELGVIKDTEKLFTKLTAPTQKLPKNIGNMYTASIFGGLISYMLSKPTNEIAGKRIAMFSFGSGMCSSFYSITIRSGAKLETLIDLLQHIPVMLENRQNTSTAEFENTLTNQELTYNKAPFEPISNVDNLLPDSWYLTHIDSAFKRYYAQKK